MKEMEAVLGMILICGMLFIAFGICTANSIEAKTNEIVRTFCGVLTFCFGCGFLAFIIYAIYLSL